MSLILYLSKNTFFDNHVVRIFDELNNKPTIMDVGNEKISKSYFKITENIQHGVIWINEKGKILHLNELFSRQLGYELDSFALSTIFEINPHFNLISWRDTWKELCEKGEVKQETQHINADGVIFSVLFKGILFETGLEKICYCIVDISNEGQGKMRSLVELTSSITHAGSWQFDIVKKEWTLTDEIFKLLHLEQSEKPQSLTDLLASVMSPEEHSVFLTNIENVKRNGKSFSMEFGVPTLTKNKYNYLRLTAVAESGKEDTLSIYGIIQDISEINARTVEMYLAKHSVDYGHEAMAWIDKQGEFVYANRAYKKLTGYSEKDVVKLSIFDVNHTFNKKSWEQLWQRMRDEKSSIIETSHFSKDKGEIPVEVYTHFLTFEGKEYLCTFLRDMRERQEKTRPQRLAQFALEHNPMMVLWINKTGQVCYANKSACQQLEYKATELEKKNITEISSSYPDIRIWNARWRIMKEEEGTAYEEKSITKSGKEFPVEVTRHYIDHEGEEFICVFIKDITERKAQELVLKDTLDDTLTQSANLTKEISVLRKEMKTKGNFGAIVTQSNKYMRVLTEIRRVAETEATVLITGETGTGKELLAKAVHELSERSEKTFVKVNAAVIPENLFESELFGHEKGSFTGAHQAREGRFEVANGGTIFLDEIGEMAIGLQAKLLRVLQEGEFERIGGTKTLKVDVRVVAATNRNLEQMVQEGKFREDLYYRLNVFPIYNLPLRDRIEDVPFLVKFFVKKYARKIGREVKEIPEAGLKKLMLYDFPGNVRELENMVERAIILSDSKYLNLNAVLKADKKSNRQKKGDLLTLDEIQKAHIVKVIRKCNGRVTGKDGAAVILGLNDKTLYSRIKKLGIEKKEYFGA